MLVDTEQKAMEALQILVRNPGGFVVDTETSGLTMYSAKTPARICGVAIGWEHTNEHDQYWSFRHAEGNNLPLWWLQVLIWLLADRCVIGHNVKFDIHMLMVEGMGFKVPKQLKCSQIAAHTANENRQKYSLKPLCEELFGTDSVKSNTALLAELKRRKAGKESIYLLPAAMVAAYAIDDLRLCRMLLAHSEREVARWGMSAVLEERFTYQVALIRCEARGLPLDVEETLHQIALMVPRIADYRERMWKMQQTAGFTEPVNVNSPKQLKSWLKLPNTSKERIKEILKATPREDLQTLLDYRFATKAEGTYFRPFLELVDSLGRLHTSFLVNGTVTWRLSSREPNLQNCSPFVKNCFRAPAGWMFVELDFSAIEPRLAAHYTEDPDLIESFWKGHDFHCTTAKMLYKIPGKVDKESKARKDAKTLGLGAIYNLGSHKMARQLGLRHERDAQGNWIRHEELVWALNLETEQLIQKACSDQDAEFCTCLGKKARDDFFYAIPTLQPTIKAVQAVAKRNKYIRIPLFGTVQRFDRKRARNGWVKSLNSLIQHSCAMILMRAFIALDKLLRDDSSCQIVGTIHDSIILLVREGAEFDTNIRTAKRVMEETTKLRVPIVADVKAGTSLGNMVNYAV